MNIFKPLLIAGATGYSIEQLKPWVLSAREHMKYTDIVVIVQHTTDETIQWLKSNDIHVVYHLSWNPNVAPHVNRFLGIARYLELNKDYNYVISTDIRDVVFQSDPFDFLMSKFDKSKKIYVGIEGLTYKNEPWGFENIKQTFDSNIVNFLEDKMIYNVGVVAGLTSFIGPLFQQIGTFGSWSPNKICDQAIYNYLLHTLYSNDVSFSYNSEFVINLGTTFPAIQAGSGDIGKIYLMDRKKTYDQYMNAYKEYQPYISNGVYRSDKIPNEKISIVHQWDRVPELSKFIREKYV